MKTNKYILVAGLATALVGSVMTFTGTVFAQEITASLSSPNKMVLEIGPAGKVLMRGTVSAVTTNSLTVKSWGGDWVVNVSSSTALMPLKDMAQFVVGDFVGVQGTVSTSAAWTIDATLVRNWTVRQTINDNKQEVKQLIRSVAAKNWEGVVGDVNADGSFKLKIGTASYDVKMQTGAKIVDKNYFTLDLSKIKTGDTVRVYGPAVDTVITASVVRNTSYDLKTMNK